MLYDPLTMQIHSQEIRGERDPMSCARERIAAGDHFDSARRNFNLVNPVSAWDSRRPLGDTVVQFIFALFFTSFFAFSIPTSQANTSETIGENDSIAVKADGSNVDAAFRPYLDAFGMIVIDGRAACTATHLGNGYVLTAGHCFYYGSAMGTLVKEGGACEDVKVKWGYRGTHTTGTSQCKEVILAVATRLADFAIFRVDRAPRAKIGFTTESHRTNPGTKISLFGHPKQKALYWSNYCSVKEAPVHRGAESGQFLHQCDTDKGDSGAAILSINRAGKLKIVGVHTGQYNAQQSSKPQSSQFNTATFFYDIKNELSEKGLDLEKVVN